MNLPTESKSTLQGIEDVQNTPDVRHLDINKVGIKSIRHPVIVKDKSGGAQSTRRFGGCGPVGRPLRSALES